MRGMVVCEGGRSTGVLLYCETSTLETICDLAIFFPNASSKPSRHVESVKVFSMIFTSMCGDILCLSSTTTTECDLPTLSMNDPDKQTSHRIYRFISTEGKVCKWNNEHTANERTGCSITGSVQERLGQYDD